MTDKVLNWRIYTDNVEVVVWILRTFLISGERTRQDKRRKNEERAKHLLYVAYHLKSSLGFTVLHYSWKGILKSKLHGLIRCYIVMLMVLGFSINLCIKSLYALVFHYFHFEYSTDISNIYIISNIYLGIKIS